MNALARIAGRVAPASALFLTIYWYGYAAFMPYGDIETSLSPLALHPAWQPLNAIGVCGALLGMLALPGLHAVQAREVGPRGDVAFLFALGGTALLLGPMLWDTILWQALASHDPALLDFDGPIYRSPAFLPFFAFAGLAWALGHLAFGIVTTRARVLPHRPASLMAVGAPVFALGAMTGPLQGVVRSVGITLFAIGLAGLGRACARVERGGDGELHDGGP